MLRRRRRFTHRDRSFHSQKRPWLPPTRNAKVHDRSQNRPPTYDNIRSDQILNKAPGSTITSYTRSTTRQTVPNYNLSLSFHDCPVPDGKKTRTCSVTHQSRTNQGKPMTKHHHLPVYLRSQQYPPDARLEVKTAQPPEPFPSLEAQVPPLEINTQGAATRLVLCLGEDGR